MDPHPGLSAEKTITVERHHTASHLGSGGVPVYATPSMILHMEETSREAVDHLLGPGAATVGTYVRANHLAATPEGMRVRIRSELVKVDGRMLTFKIEAWDEFDKIGEAEHIRAIIDLNRFGEKIARKKALAKKA